MLRRKIVGTLGVLGLFGLAANAFAGGLWWTPWWRSSPRAATYGADVARAWGDQVFQVIKTEKLTPPVASRLIGYWGVAMYEAVIPGMPGSRSMRGQLNGLARLPWWNAFSRYHWPTAANAASARLLRGMLAPGAASLAAIDALEASHLPATTGVGSLPAKVRRDSIAWGYRVADAIVSWSRTDGYDVYANCAFTPPVGPEYWRPLGSQTALQPCWGQLRPFVLEDGAECAPVDPPPFSTDPSSAYYLAAQEVFDVTANLTEEQKTIAWFWADGAGTGTPPGHWVAIVGQVAEQYDLSLATAAEAYLRVGLSVADAFINCWYTKFIWNLPRPQTYIQDHFPGQGSWAPLIATPPFPTYTSGHSSQSGASSYLLADLLGELTFTDATHAPAMAARTYAGFTAAGQEAALSRLYGGIHFTFDNDAGFAAGQSIAQKILERVRFRSRR